MAFTNQTPNYGLPQYIGTDKPSWLVDQNGAMSDIDTGIHNAQTKADTADTKADNNATAITDTLKLTGFRTFSIPADGVKTYSQLFDEVFTALTSFVNLQGSNFRFRFVRAFAANWANCYPEDTSLKDNTYNDQETFTYASLDSSEFAMITAKTSGSLFKRYDLAGSTLNDKSSNVPTSSSCQIEIEMYTKNV